MSYLDTVSSWDLDGHGRLDVHTCSARVAHAIVQCTGKARQQA